MRCLLRRVFARSSLTIWLIFFAPLVNGAIVETSHDFFLTTSTETSAASGSASSSASLSLALDYFDSALGNLNSVTLVFNSLLQVTGGALNSSTSGILSHSATASAILGSPLMAPGIFDSVTDAGGCAGFGCAVPLSGISPASISATSTLASEFQILTGTGTFNFDYTLNLSQLTSLGIPISGLETMIEPHPGSANATWAGSVRFIYDYEPGTSPPPVPLPASVWLFGTALVSFIGFSRRRKLG